MGVFFVFSFFSHMPLSLSPTLQKPLQKTEVSGANAAKLALKLAYASKVDRAVTVPLFHVPGGAACGFVDALGRSDVSDEKLLLETGFPVEMIRKLVTFKGVLMGSEVAAPYAADGFARRSQLPGLVMSSSGPGALHLQSGIASSFSDSIPLVVLTFQVASHAKGTEAFQDTPVAEVSRSLAKECIEIQRVDEIPGAIFMALETSMAGRPGPVLIDIPQDISLAQMSIGILKHEFGSKVSAVLEAKDELDWEENFKSIEEALRRAESPLIIVGGGAAKHRDSYEGIRRLAHKLACPLVETSMACGSGNPKEESSLGMVGMYGEAQANFAVNEADLLLGFGTRFDARAVGDSQKFKDKMVVSFNIDPQSESSLIGGSQISIQGDLKESLLAFETFIDSRERFSSENDWKNKVDAVSQSIERDIAPLGPNEKLNPHFVSQRIFKRFKEEGEFTADIGNHQMIFMQQATFDGPEHFSTHCGQGPMGSSIAGALGKWMNEQNKLPEEQKKIPIVIVGDGSLRQNIEELSTISRMKCPMKIFCFRDDQLGMVAQLKDRYPDMDRSYVGYENDSIDYAKIAEGFGLEGYRIENEGALNSVLDSEFIDDETPQFFEILIDPEVRPYVSELYQR